MVIEVLKKMLNKPLEHIRTLILPYWRDAKTAPPEADGRYLVVRLIASSNLCVDIFDYATNLEKVDGCAFKGKRSGGFYLPDDGWGATELSDALCWVPLPELPPMTQGLTFGDTR